jgi:hypothetical protein
MQRCFRRLSECARELTGRQAAFPCELDQWDPSLQIRVDVFFGTTFLPRRETARLSGRHLKAAINLSNVKFDSEHDVINKQVVDLLGPVQRGEK